MIKIETVQLTNSKITVLELSKHSALRLAQDLIRQVNGSFHGEEFKIEDGHYLKVGVQRVQDHIKDAIAYLAAVLPKLSEDEQQCVLADLASGDDSSIWNRFNHVRLIIERMRLDEANR
jgi:hypothetical protein